jgi:hypothetical protein
MTTGVFMTWDEESTIEYYFFLCSGGSSKSKVYRENEIKIPLSSRLKSIFF